MNLNLLHEKKSLKCINSVVASVKLITDTKLVKKGGLDNLSVPGFGTVTRCHKKGTVKSAEHGVYVLRLFALPRRS